MSENAYSVANELLKVAADALLESHGGVPDRRFVAMGFPVPDVPDQLTVYLSNVTPSATFSAGLVQGYEYGYSVVLTRAYPAQPGDAGVIPADVIDMASRILYEDLDLLVHHFLCVFPYEATLGSISAIDPLGGVAGWTIPLSITA
jgi:hypothetical protein